MLATINDVSLFSYGQILRKGTDSFTKWRNCEPLHAMSGMPDPASRWTSTSLHSRHICIMYSLSRTAPKNNDLILFPGNAKEPKYPITLSILRFLFQSHKNHSVFSKVGFFTFLLTFLRTYPSLQRHDCRAMDLSVVGGDVFPPQEKTG